jgi:NAD(P)-dependent dehydrogenase (short-subunit alcohol dehydrogenase family)
MSDNLSFGLKGKTVLLTGATGAIGGAVAKGFADAGCRVAVVDIDQTRCNEFAAELGSQHAGFGVDLTDTARLPSLVEKVESTLGKIDVLVNIAGVIKRADDLFQVTEADFDFQMGINVKVPFFLSQAVAKAMVDDGRTGAIINYSSQGWMSGGFGGSVVYNAGKGAITTMTRGLARSWADHGIRVNSVAPGLVETPMLGLDRMSDTQIDNMVGGIPMKRLAQPQDHTGATLFLASDHAAYMTGATINVSGGFLMY